jgi:hypothetical protein
MDQRLLTGDLARSHLDHDVVRICEEEMLRRAICSPTTSVRAHHRHERVRHEHTVFPGYMPLPKRWRYRILPTAPSPAFLSLSLSAFSSGHNPVVPWRKKRGEGFILSFGR